MEESQLKKTVEEAKEHSKNFMEKIEELHSIIKYDVIKTTAEFKDEIVAALQQLKKNLEVSTLGITLIPMVAKIHKDEGEETRG
jgi:hypothetical protein